MEKLGLPEFGPPAYEGELAGRQETLQQLAIKIDHGRAIPRLRMEMGGRVFMSTEVHSDLDAFEATDFRHETAWK